jgi:protocatechuate 3,4-dioxygenase alpha subunit
MTRRGLTPSQTVGPFFHGGLLREGLNVLTSPQTQGERIRIEGHVYDGDRAPVPDAVVEIWQANAAGRYHHPADRGSIPLDPAFTGFGRCGTDEAGRFWFETVKPGRVPLQGAALQAPHICVAVFARGLLDHLATRLYFEDERANDDDPVLRRVPEDRRATLLARRLPVDGKVVYRFDVVLQGDGETVFFEL